MVWQKMTCTALLDYEKTVGVAASAGLEIATKEINYQWTYVQSVFFTSTIITTVGEYWVHSSGTSHSFHYLPQGQVPSDKWK